MKKFLLAVLVLMTGLGFLAAPAGAAGPDDYGDSRMEYRVLRSTTTGELHCRNAVINIGYGPQTRCVEVSTSGEYGRHGWYYTEVDRFTLDANGWWTLDNSVPWNHGYSAWCNYNGPTGYEFHGSEAIATAYGPVARGMIWRLYGGHIQAMTVTYSPITGECTEEVGWTDVTPSNINPNGEYA